MKTHELLRLFPESSPLQVNIITSPGSMVYLPSPRFFDPNTRNAKLRALLDAPVVSIDVEVHDNEGTPVPLLIINDKEAAKHEQTL